MKAPLADRLRPKNIDEMFGQSHLLGQGKALRRIIEKGEIPNMIFYGSPGIGKTTLAGIISQASGKKLYKLNATHATTADIKNIIADAGSLLAPGGVLLYLDEIQYFNKKQQQSLLEFIENGMITLIASTTENPYFYVYGALLSRCTVFEFKPLTPVEAEGAVRRAEKFIREEDGIDFKLSKEAVKLIASASGGDVRRAVNMVEMCCLSADEGVEVTAEQASEVAGQGGNRYDKGGDEHYDILSAYQKSMRGSDPDAAVYYLARLLDAGDMISACRRLMVCACEDCSLAYPQIIPIVKSCVDIAFQVGLPEAQIPLANAVILVATSPKSNSAVSAIGEAMADVRGLGALDIPSDLKDAHYGGASKLGRGKGYMYPHSYKNHYVKQQYLPDQIKDKRYYDFGENKTEQAAKAYWDKIKDGNK